MNIYQRIVLILGAIALVVAIWTSPKIYIISGENGVGGIFISDNKTMFGRLPASLIDCRMASFRVISVLGSTLFIFFALKGIKK